jgi:type II secretory pathway component PulF
MAIFASSSLSLDDLIALNDEIAALVRAGVPLEKGLGALGRDLPHRLARFSATLAERMDHGQTLAQAISDAGLPPAYGAMIEAGLRTGRLAQVLEDVATSARRLAELRRGLLLALWYPLSVLILAYGLLVFYVLQIAPSLLVMDQLHRPWLLRTLADVGRHLELCAAVPPLVLLTAIAILWHRSGRAEAVQPGYGNHLLRVTPWGAALARNASGAWLTELLALLIEHGIPLHEAVRLAGAASGAATLTQTSSELAASLEQGTAPAPSDSRWTGFPPLVRWLLASVRRQSALVRSLRYAADDYRRRAQRRADELRVYLPIVLLLGIGATATLLYALVLFIPYSDMLRQLGQPN